MARTGTRSGLKPSDFDFDEPAPLFFLGLEVFFFASGAAAFLVRDLDLACDFDLDRGLDLDRDLDLDRVALPPEAGPEFAKMRLISSDFFPDTLSPSD